MALKIALAQLRIQKGQITNNLSQIEEICLKACEDNADVLVLPSMCLCGYGLGDDWHDYSLVSELERYNDYLKSLSTTVNLVWGNVYLEDGILYDGLFYASNGVMICKRAKKVFTPHNIYQEERYFKRCHAPIESFDINGTSFALVALEEIFDDAVFKEIMDINPQQLIVLGHKYWTRECENCVDVRIKELSKQYLMPTINYVNSVGMQNIGKSIVMYDGKSAVYEDGNRVLTLSDDFQPDYSLNTNCDHQVKPNRFKLLTCLVNMIQYFDEEVLPKGSKWIIGLSGGLDSSINAALMKLALGSDKIIAYNLASQYNSDETKDNARILAKKLKIELRDGSISDLYDSTLKTVKEFNYVEEPKTLVKENIQARLRGNLLSTFAQIENGVIINNGNKVEIALGYATLYGDTIGVASPLGDLLKTDLFDLAHDINNYYNDEIIPERLLPKIVDGEIIWEMAPSAELRDNQSDPMKWYYHDLLIDYIMDKNHSIIDLLKMYLDGSIYTSEFGQWIRYYHLDEGTKFIEDLEWILRQMKTATFKRLQMPPILVVSNHGFGASKLESQGMLEGTKTYQELKAQILAL